MLQKHGTMHVSFRRCLGLMAFAAAAMLLVGNAGWAKEGKNDRAARLLATVRVPPTTTNTTAGALYSFDISWVDQPTPALLYR